MARRKIVAGNWKMNMTPSQAVKLVEELNKKQNNDEQEINLIKNKTTENKKEITNLKRNQTIAKKASEEDEEASNECEVIPFKSKEDSDEK